MCQCALSGNQKPPSAIYNRHRQPAICDWLFFFLKNIKKALTLCPSLIIIILAVTNGPLAQLVEHATLNRVVQGSIP